MNKLNIAEETNANVLKKIRMKKILVCSYCPPHKYENSTRMPPKHGWTKPRYKDKRAIKFKWILAEAISATVVAIKEISEEEYKNRKRR